MPIEYQRAARVIVEDRVTAVSCNKCGDRSDVMADPNFSDTIQRYHRFDVGGGPETGFPRDLSTLSYVLCSACLENFVDSFLLPAQIEYMMRARIEPNPAVRMHDQVPVWITEDWVSTHRSLAQDEDNPAWTPADEGLDWPHRGGVYRVGAGERQLEVVGHVLDVDDGNRPSVVFRALYEAPTLWVIPLADWEAADFELVELDPPESEGEEQGVEDSDATDADVSDAGDEPPPQPEEAVEVEPVGLAAVGSGPVVYQLRSPYGHAAPGADVGEESLLSDDAIVGIPAQLEADDPTQSIGDSE